MCVNYGDSPWTPPAAAGSSVRRGERPPERAASRWRSSVPGALRRDDGKFLKICCVSLITWHTIFKSKDNVSRLVYHLWAVLRRNGSPEPIRAGGAWRPGRTARCPEPGGCQRGRRGVDGASLRRSGSLWRASRGTGRRRPEAPGPNPQRPDPPCSYLWEAEGEI